jgi:hypothetical protein
VAGLISSAIAVLIAIHPIIGVSSRLSYASKIAGTVIVSNLLGLAIYRSRKRIPTPEPSNTSGKSHL